MKIGKYTLLKKIATGGMAEIYLAQQEGPAGFQKILVIKRILPHLAEDERFVTMFLNEARLAALLNHPNVVSIYDLGEDLGTYYLAMEYIHGRALDQIAARCEALGRKVPLEIVARILADACIGLDYAHKFGSPDGTPLNLVHRDVSPQNILVTFGGLVKVVDFGVAKAATNTGKTQTGAVKGKYAYMSPEQIAGAPLDCRSDVFALGVVLFELATGRRPFGEKSDLLAITAILNDPPQTPQQLVPGFPTSLEQIIFRSLEKDRNRRYQDAQEMQLDLERFIRFQGKYVTARDLANFMEELFGDLARQNPLRLGEPETLGDSTAAELTQGSASVASPGGVSQVGAAAPDRGAAPARSVSQPRPDLAPTGEAAALPPPAPTPGSSWEDELVRVPPAPLPDLLLLEDTDGLPTPPPVLPASRSAGPAAQQPTLLLDPEATRSPTPPGAAASDPAGAPASGLVGGPTELATDQTTPIPRVSLEKASTSGGAAAPTPVESTPTPTPPTLVRPTPAPAIPSPGATAIEPADQALAALLQEVQATESMPPVRVARPAGSSGAQPAAGDATAALPAASPVSTATGPGAPEPPPTKTMTPLRVPPTPRPMPREAPVPPPATPADRQPPPADRRPTPSARPTPPARRQPRSGLSVALFLIVGLLLLGGLGLGSILAWNLFTDEPSPGPGTASTVTTPPPPLPTPPANLGQVVIATDAEAMIFVDGLFFGKNPLPPRYLPSGFHLIEARWPPARNRPPIRRSVEVKPGEIINVVLY